LTIIAITADYFNVYPLITLIRVLSERAFQYSEHFVNEVAHFESLFVEGGSMQSQVYAMAARRITDHLMKDFEARYTKRYQEML
jgi:hypothetical protein